MRLPTFVTIACFPLTTIGCGESPVSVQDGRILNHEGFGFSMHLPEDLAAQGWSLKASRDVSVHDNTYSFGFRPPESVLSGPPTLTWLNVVAHKPRTPTYSTVEEWVEQQLRDPRDMEKVSSIERLELSVTPMNFGGIEAFEIVQVFYHKELPNTLTYDYSVYIVHGSLRIKMHSNVVWPLGSDQSPSAAHAEGRPFFQEMVAIHSAIAQTVRFAL